MTRTAIALLLVLLAIGLSLLQRLKLEAELVVATVRAIVQLVVLSSVIHLVFGSIGPAGAVVLLMVAAAAWTSARRLAGVPRPFIVCLGSIGVATGVTILILFGGGVFPLEARFLIVVTGMIVGNCMTATSLAGARLRDELRDKTMEVEARLALGVPVRDALHPYTRRAVTMSLVPTLDATKNVGLVAVPGAFVGMILAGASPGEAAQTQAIVMFMLLGAVSLAATIAVGLTSKRFVAPGERLDLASLHAG